MKDDVLEDLLNDILKDQNKILKKIELLTSETPESISNKNEQMTVEISEVSLYRLNKEFQDASNRLMELVKTIPSQIDTNSIVEHKLVIFSNQYNDGEYGISAFFRWLLILTISVVATYSSIKYLPDYYMTNSEDKIYAKTLQWHYYQMSKDGQRGINDVYRKFEQDDTLINNQLKKLTKENSINR